MSEAPQPTVSLLDYLDRRFNDVEKKLDKVNGTVAHNRDVCVEFKAWKDGHEQTHVRERGIYAMLITAAAAVGSALGLYKP